MRAWFVCVCWQYGYRAVSPGLVLREYREAGVCSPHRITTYSYLTTEPHYLRRPLQPYDRAPASPHFHRPPSGTGTGTTSRPSSRQQHARPGMRVLVDSMRAETPRPKSPRMNNEEPIELSHYPAAYKPPPGTQPKIERPDFPAPPYPYTDPGECSAPPRTPAAPPRTPLTVSVCVCVCVCVPQSAGGAGRTRTRACRTATRRRRASAD